ncbi:complex I NDUFA9 subunit family protein [Frateuria defendens]|uniref:complex I NDUFA9 subunit family protein n=1 Tax=Frateuria defendens TaxID=2219559 RepID=UPI00066FC8B8|nr:complex I NDUFA9 subunit family protein [Frateuria defendens]
MNSQRLVILGGTGFVGSRLVSRLAADGHRILLLTRNRERHRTLAVLPQVSLRNADVHDPDELKRALHGADAAINLVGILNPHGRDSFQRVHVELVRNLIEACRANGVRRLHQMSALKAGHGLSQYLKTRGEAEVLVRQSGLDWTIYQPSVIFGPGDGLVTRFARLLRWMPVLPLARAGSRMAPTYVGDVAEAYARCVANPSLGTGHSFELYGPEVLTLGEIVQAIRDAAGRRTRILPLPDSLGRLQAQLAQWLPGKPFSPDNFLSLRTDSVGRQDGYAALGIAPQAFTPWLPRLLGGPGRQGRLDRSRAMRR